MSTGGYTFAAAAKSLGIGEQSLRQWHAKFAPPSAPCSENASIAALKAENQRLRLQAIHSWSPIVSVSMSLSELPLRLRSSQKSSAGGIVLDWAHDRQRCAVFLRAASSRPRRGPCLRSMPSLCISTGTSAGSSLAGSAAVIPRLARELANELPEEKGFSERNLKLMVQFAHEYPDAFAGKTSFGQPAVAQLPTTTEGQPPVARIPWAHNVLLMQRVKNRNDRHWYIQQTLVNGWSRNVLLAMIQSGAHARQGQAITNFERLLPSPQSDLVFDFLTLQDPFHERELETNLLHQLERFLLELGQGFAFVGRQYYYLKVGDSEFYVPHHRNVRPLSDRNRPKRRRHQRGDERNDQDPSERQDSGAGDWRRRPDWNGLCVRDNHDPLVHGHRFRMGHVDHHPSDRDRTVETVAREGRCGSSSSPSASLHGHSPWKAGRPRGTTVSPLARPSRRAGGGFLPN